MAGATSSNSCPPDISIPGEKTTINNTSKKIISDHKYYEEKIKQDKVEIRESHFKLDVETASLSKRYWNEDPRCRSKHAM